MHHIHERCAHLAKIHMPRLTFRRRVLLPLPSPSPSPCPLRLHYLSSITCVYSNGAECTAQKGWNIGGVPRLDTQNVRKLRHGCVIKMPCGMIASVAGFLLGYTSLGSKVYFYNAAVSRMLFRTCDKCAARDIGASAPPESSSSPAHCALKPETARVKYDAAGSWETGYYKIAMSVVSHYRYLLHEGYVDHRLSCSLISLSLPLPSLESRTRIEARRLLSLQSSNQSQRR